MYIININRIYQVLEPGVSRLRGLEMDSAPSLDNAWIRVGDNGVIEAVGTMDSMPDPGTEPVTDACGGDVLPAFCDSHTHIIYAGSREGEFLDKIRGLSYEGTGAAEVKSGYGLTVEDELKMLRVAARLRDAYPGDMKCTFLGAHAVGRAYVGRQSEYVDMLIRDMLPAVAAEGLADYVDVFCDRGFFTVDETDRILTAAARYGLRPKIHANELDCSGGVQVGVKHDALSVDHLERMGEEEIEVLRGSDTVATMLPGASFFLGMPYAPARRAVEQGLTVALASDYNPGSSPSGDMRFVWALGCIQMRLTPAEALAATTINGAAAMGLGESLGAVAPGRTASLIVSRPVRQLAFIPYAYTTPWVEKVMIHGKFL